MLGGFNSYALSILKERAIDYFKKAVDLYPTNPEYRYVLAQAYAALRRYSEALEQAEKAHEYAKSDIEKSQYKTFVGELKLRTEGRKP